jgi:hypothetical protein
MQVNTRRWKFPSTQRLAVISPFCTVEGLRSLSESTSEPVALISRPEELDKLDNAAQSLFGQVMVLREAAETDDGEDTSTTASTLHGLHAKAYIGQSAGDTHIVIGSANATKSALVDCVNVEILAGLTGKTAKVKGIDELLSPQGFGNVLEQYAPNKAPIEDEAVIAARERLEEARRVLSTAALRITCQGRGTAGSLLSARKNRSRSTASRTLKSGPSVYAPSMEPMRRHLGKVAQWQCRPVPWLQ